MSELKDNNTSYINWSDYTISDDHSLFDNKNNNIGVVIYNIIKEYLIYLVI